MVKEDNISERVYTIREGDTLMLQCLVTGHPRPQVSPTLASPAPYLLLTLGPTLGSELEKRQQELGIRGGCWRVNPTQKAGAGK